MKVPSERTIKSQKLKRARAISVKELAVKIERAQTIVSKLSTEATKLNGWGYIPTGSVMAHKSFYALNRAWREMENAIQALDEEIGKQ